MDDEFRKFAFEGVLFSKRIDSLSKMELIVEGVRFSSDFEESDLGKLVKSLIVNSLCTRRSDKGFNLAGTDEHWELLRAFLSIAQDNPTTKVDYVPFDDIGH